MSGSPVVVVRQKGYEPGNGKKRFHAREIGDGKFYDLVTLEEFELGEDLELEQNDQIESL